VLDVNYIFSQHTPNERCVHGLSNAPSLTSGLPVVAEESGLV
jgi:hypothetical protein